MSLPNIYSQAEQFRHNMTWLILSLIVLIIDQLSKNYIMLHLEPYDVLPVLSWMNITLAYNTGAAFSLLSEAGGWQRYAFLLVGLLITTVLIAWLGRLRGGEKVSACALALIIGGAVGNMWDRFFLGHVVDFIEVYYQTWHWPAFNVADSAICVGAVVLGFKLIKAED